MSNQSNVTPFTTWKVLTAVTSVIGLVSLIAIFANSCVLYAFVTSKKLQRTPCNYFAVNLALSDICIVLGPMSLWLLNVWYNYEFFVFSGDKIIPDSAETYYSSFWNLLDATLMCVSVSNLAVLSVERYLALEMPIWHRTKVTRRRTQLACLFPWIFSIIVMAPSLANENDHIKRYIHKAAPVLISCFVVILSYALLLRAVHAKRRQKSTKSNKERLRRKREISLTFRLSLLTVVFLICWVPVTIFLVWSASDRNSQSLTIKTYLILAPTLKLLSYLNSLFNPFLYIFGRPAFARILKSKLCCKQKPKAEQASSSVSHISRQKSRSACHLNIAAETRL